MLRTSRDMRSLFCSAVSSRRLDSEEGKPAWSRVTGGLCRVSAMFLRLPGGMGRTIRKPTESCWGRGAGNVRIGKPIQKRGNPLGVTVELVIFLSNADACFN